MPITTCVDCKEKREVSRIRKDFPRCRKCASKSEVKSISNQYNKERTRKGHTRVCIDCGDSSKVANKTNSKSARCKKCSALNRNKDIEDSKVVFKDGKRIRLFKRVCNGCGGEDYLTKRPKNIDTIICRDCTSKKARGKTKGVRGKTISKLAIEKAQKINREHREAIESGKRVVPKQTKTDDEMIASWKKNNKVKKEKVSNWEHYISGGLGSDTSAIGV